MIKVHLSHYIYDTLKGKNFNENGDGNLTFCQIPAPFSLKLVPF